MQKTASTKIRLLPEWSEAERVFIEKGLTPKDAREISTFCVFGGANGGYGTGIQGMVMSGDRWESEKENSRYLI